MGLGGKIVLILLKGKNIAQGTEEQHNGKKHRPLVSAASVMSILAWKIIYSALSCLAAIIYLTALSLLFFSLII